MVENLYSIAIFNIIFELPLIPSHVDMNIGSLALSFVIAQLPLVEVSIFVNDDAFTCKLSILHVPYEDLVAAQVCHFEGFFIFFHLLYEMLVDWQVLSKELIDSQGPVWTCMVEKVRVFSFIDGVS